MCGNMDDSGRLWMAVGDCGWLLMTESSGGGGEGA